MNKDHVSGLDGLRAIAILGVVFYHMIPNIVPGGYLGVTAFFTIMGYLMVFPRKRDEKSLDKAWTYQGAVGGTLSFAGREASFSANSVRASTMFRSRTSSAAIRRRYF